MTAPVASYCFPHESYFLSTLCPACQQGIGPLPRAHAAGPPDLTDLEPAWQEAVTREATARCDCPAWACIEPGSVGCYFGEAAR